MRDFSSCFNEHAVNVSNTSSNYSKTSCNSHLIIPSIQNAVVNSYKTILSNQSHVLITLTWTITNTSSQSQSLIIIFNNDPSTSIKLNTKKSAKPTKKSLKLPLNNSQVSLHYDLSKARFSSGPEPIDGYYLLITVDSQIALILGDINIPAKKLKIGAETAKFSLISRQEHFSGRGIYSTRARLRDGGAEHEIIIRCSGENEGLKYPALSLTIDKKTVISVKRLQWNFRGNQTFSLDGLIVDLMWDVHDWFNNPGLGLGLGYGVFMFRTRSGIDKRLLWLQDKTNMGPKDEQDDKVDFSLLICASKTA